MKTKLFVCISILIMISSFAAADMYISLPKIAEIDTVNVEKGATPKIAIRYKNNSLADVNIDSIVIHLTFNNNVIDNIISIKNANARQLGEDGTPMIDITNGEIIYKLKKQFNSLSVPAGQTKDLAYITFHLTQPLLMLQPLNLQNISILQGQQFFYWSTLAPLNLVRNQVTQMDIKGITFNQPNVYLKNSAAPIIPPSSWNSVQQAMYSGNMFGKKDIGNTLVLNWAAIGNLSLSGNNAIDFTPHYNRKLHYRLFRNEGIDSFGPASGAVELTEPGLADDVEPSNRIPWTGNIPNVPYMYQDPPETSGPKYIGLSDGIKYYYQLQVCDDCQPNWNFVTSPSFFCVPLDTTPPAEIPASSLTATPGEGKITLDWENPKDPDFYGIIILRTVGVKGPIEPVDLGSASPVGPDYKDGPDYSNLEGTEPFPGKGTIVLIADFSNTHFEDVYDPANQMGPGLKNGTVYNYRLYTFDAPSMGPPREMGFNYSKVGVAISRTPGTPPQPISDFKVSETQNIGEVKLTWTDSTNGAANTMIRYTTTGFKDLKNENSGELLNIYPNSGGPEEAIEYLDTRYPLYFKAFAVNQTDQELDPKDPANMAKHLFSSGVTAALKAVTGKIATYVFNLKPGINYIAIPFPAQNITDANDKPMDISTIAKLVDAINAQAGSKVVRTLGRWDPVQQKAVGIVSINYAIADRYTTTQNFSVGGPVIQGEALVVTVSKPCTFTLTSSVQ